MSRTSKSRWTAEATSLVYPHKTIELPTVLKHSNGWVSGDQGFAGYIPATFGRGHEGEEKAREWYQGWVEKHIPTGELPLSLNDQPLNSKVRTDAHTVGIAWFVEGIGPIQLQIFAGWYGSRHDNGDTKWSLQIPHAWLQIAQMADRGSGPAPPISISPWMRGQVVKHIDNQTPPQLKKDIDDFIADPWAAALQRLDIPHLLAARIAPTASKEITLIPHSYDFEGHNGTADLTDAKGWYGKGYDMLMPGRKRMNLTNEQLSAIADVFIALKAMGVDCKIETLGDFENANQKIITSLTIDIPKIQVSTDDIAPWRRGLLEEHQLTVTESGIGVTCGFAEDERNWTAHQQRQVQAILSGIIENDDNDDIDENVEEWSFGE